MSVVINGETETDAQEENRIKIHNAYTFPGNITAFERFVLQTDSKSTPIVFRVLMRLRGPVLRDALSEAFQIAVQRQPMFQSVISPESRSWHRCDCCPQLLWTTSNVSESDQTRLPVQPIEITREIGLRVKASLLEDGLLISLDFHHACCDGQGARQFIAEWLTIYDQLTSNSEFTPAYLEVEKLASRHIYRKPNTPVTFWEGLWNLYITLSGKTARVPVYSKNSEERIILEATLSPDETSSLRAWMKQEGFTLNDLGLACSMYAFHQSFPRFSQGRKITVLNPVDLRYPSDLRVPACNRVGMAYLRRKLSTFPSFDALLTSLREEMQYVKRYYVGAEFLHGLTALSQSSFLWKTLHKSTLFTPTLQFTCLGDTTRSILYKLREVDGAIQFGQLRLESISGIAPVGPGVPISIASCETSNRISMTFHGHQRYMSPEQMQIYSNAFMSLLRCRFVESNIH